MKIVKGLLGATLAVTILTGCNLLDTVQGEGKTVVISDDVALESTMADAKVAVTKPERVNLDVDLTYEQLFGISNEGLHYVKENSFYKTDVHFQDSTLIKNMNVKELSKDKKKALSIQGNEVNVYNLDNNEMTKVTDIKNTDGDVVFADPHGHYISYYDFDRSSYTLIQTETLEKHMLNFNELFNEKDFSFESPVVYNDLIYLSTHSGKDGSALYKLSFDGKKELVLKLPQENDRIAKNEWINENTVVFNGNYNGESGIFLYDTNKEEVNKVVSGGTDSEGTWTPFYSISPDGKKMLFDTVVREDENFFNNIYIATIENNKLTNSTRIMEKVELPAVIALLTYWDEDSSTFYIPRTEKLKAGYSEEKIDYILKYEFDKIKAE